MLFGCRSPVCVCMFVCTVFKCCLCRRVVRFCSWTMRSILLWARTAAGSSRRGRRRVAGESGTAPSRTSPAASPEPPPVSRSLAFRTSPLILGVSTHFYSLAGASRQTSKSRWGQTLLPCLPLRLPPRPQPLPPPQPQPLPLLH